MSLAARRGFALAGLLAGLAATSYAADSPGVVYRDGLLSIQVADAPLTDILQQVKAATGMELILEGSAGNTRLTAQIAAQPVSLALPRLLEGTGINYLLLADRADPRRVATMYVGATTPGTATGATAPAGPRAVSRAPRSPLPRDEPEPMPMAEPPSPEPAETSEDDGPTAAAEAETIAAPPVTVAPGEPPGARPGFNPVFDPFGRAIPVRGQAERATRGRAVEAKPQDK